MANLDLSPGFIVTLVIMVLSLAGLIYCAVKQKRNPDFPINIGPLAVNPQIIAMGLIVVVICCAGYILATKLGSGDTARLINNEMFYSRSRAVILGRELAKKFPSAKALVIVADKEYEKNKFEANLVEGLKEGFGDKVFIEAIDSPDIPKPEEPEMMMPMEMMFKAEHFDALAEKHSGCNLIVSLMGLPPDFKDIKLWRKEDGRPKIALLDGDIETLKDLIYDDIISMLVAYKPGIKFSEKPAPNDPAMAFEERYRLVTSENIEQVLNPPAAAPATTPAAAPAQDQAKEEE